MNCRHIKELILTDYLDQETANTVRQEVEAHLAVCADCRIFEQRIRENISQPLRTSERFKPPEQVWQRIRENIETEGQAESEPADELYTQPFLKRLRDLIAGVFAAKKPALAFATVLTLLLLAVLVFVPARKQQVLVKDYLREQRMFLASADRPFNGMLDDDFSLGTSIEKYLF